MSSVASPQLRSWPERMTQALLFEIVALVFAVPLYGLFVGASGAESTRVLVVISIAVLLWTTVHNFAFDLCESRLLSRSASDRPVSVRALHAISHELTAALVSVPILVLLGDIGWWKAAWADIGLSVLYAACAFVFYAAYDWARPVPQAVRS